MKKKGITTYTPDLEHAELTIVHPAIDFKNKAYFGVWLPVKEKDKEILCLVTSDRKILVCQQQSLEKEKIKLSHRGIKFENRWSLTSIKEYINSLNPVDPRELFEEIKETFAFYIEFPSPEIYDLMTIWVLGTYLFPIFNTFPYIYVGGVKQTGKTKTLHVTSLLAFNSIFSTSVTSAALFRLVQDGRCSLFIDETEKLSNPERFTEFRALLLSGYKKSGIVQRVEKDTKDRFVVKKFEVYSPKMLGNVFGLEDILEDRCIRIIMKRTLNKEIGEREINENDPTWQQIRDKCYVFALENWEEIKEIYETLPNETKLSNREWELWHPILAIAAFLNKSIYNKMKTLAEMKTKEKHTENITETGEYILIETLLDLVKEDRYYKIKEIKERMIERFDEEQRWLSNKWIGNALRRLGIAEKRRVGAGIEFRISPEIVKDLAERLGIRPTLSSPNTLYSQESSEHSELSECSENLNNTKDVFGICEYCGKYSKVTKLNGRYICKNCVNSEAHGKTN
jgi:hypothetical protein